MADSKRKVLRSVFLDREVEETLRQAASRRHISKSGLIRTHVEQGIDAERASGQAKQGQPEIRMEKVNVKSRSSSTPAPKTYTTLIYF